MYQRSILKSLIQNKVSPKIVSGIDKRKELVFPGEKDLEFFSVLKKYCDSFGSLPNCQYLENFYELQKDDETRDVFEDLKKEGYQVFSEEEIPAYIDLQIKYTAKMRILKTSIKFEDRAKVTSTSDVQELVDNCLDEVSEISKGLRDNSGKSAILFGPEAIKSSQDDYDNRKSLGGTAICKYGIQEIDSTTGGLKPDDFVTIAAFTSQGKSCMWRFLAYNFLVQGMNLFVQTYEMNYETVRNHFYVLHANNTAVWGWGKPRITYYKVANGKLSDREEEFYRNEVIPDFASNEQYGTMYLAQPAEGNYTVDDSLADLKTVSKYEFPVDIFMIDYLTLMLPKRTGRLETSDYNRMVEYVRSASLDMGVAVVTPHQCNRKSFEDANKDKNHKYTLACMSDYHAIERSSTVAMSLFHNEEMYRAGVSQVQCLKNREGQLFSTHQLNFDPFTGHYVSHGLVKTTEETLDIIGSLDFSF